MSIVPPNWARLASNGTNLGLLKINFSTFWLGEPKCTETYLKSPQFVPFGADQTQFGDNPDTPVFTLEATHFSLVTTSNTLARWAVCSQKVSIYTTLGL